MFGAGALLLGLGAAGLGLGYLADKSGEAVDDAGSGALKLAAAGGLAAGAYYAWRRA